MKTKYFILPFLVLITACAHRFDNFRLDKSEVLIEQTLNKNFTPKEFKVFIDPLRDDSSLSDKEFSFLREILYAALELKGHKRVYTREEADLRLYFDLKLKGPYILKRTGINKVWTNFRPEFNFGFNLDRVELESAYEYLKRVRGIEVWKMHEEKFIFKHAVYVSEMEVRAFEMTEAMRTKGLDSAVLAWTSKYKSLSSSKDKAYHMGYILAAAIENLGTKSFDRKQLAIYEDNAQFRNLQGLVMAERFYQDQRKAKPLYEEFRMLTDQEFRDFYTNRIKPFDITPLYRN